VNHPFTVERGKRRGLRANQRETLSQVSLSTCLQRSYREISERDRLRAREKKRKRKKEGGGEREREREREGERAKKYTPHENAFLSRPRRIIRRKIINCKTWRLVMPVRYSDKGYHLFSIRLPCAEYKKWSTQIHIDLLDRIRYDRTIQRNGGPGSVNKKNGSVNLIEK